VPWLICLRLFFGADTWAPSTHYAALVVDDPLLRTSYGFLNFGDLVAHMQQYTFATTVAFIPHNYRRSAEHVVRLFRHNPTRLALCFHGNDHTAGEFASTDATFLNTSLAIATGRMKVHQQMTGVEYERVMVFPQGRFSREAMQALSTHNFESAVNTTTCPADARTNVRLADLTQPAVLSHAGFPLFVRTPVSNTTEVDIAFSLFFGRPILLGAHHDDFRDIQTVLSTISTVNAMCPSIVWTSVGTATRRSVLVKRHKDGSKRIRAYSRTVEIQNGSSCSEHISIEWPRIAAGGALDIPPTDTVQPDWPRIDGQDGFTAQFDLASGESRQLSYVQCAERPAIHDLGVKWAVNAFVRRRLSEIRDNHLSKHPSALIAAQRFQKRWLSFLQ
jgi:hypothetical protein